MELGKCSQYGLKKIKPSMTDLMAQSLSESSGFVSWWTGFVQLPRHSSSVVKSRSKNLIQVSLVIHYSAVQHCLFDSGEIL